VTQPAIKRITTACHQKVHKLFSGILFAYTQQHFKRNNFIFFTLLQAGSNFYFFGYDFLSYLTNKLLPLLQR